MVNNFSGVDKAALEVRVGSTFYFAGGTKVKIERIIQHENYDDENIDYDISILLLKEPLEFNNKVKSIDLAAETDELSGVATVSGWGAFVPPPLNLLPTIMLSAADVKLIDQDECKKSDHEAYQLITDRMLCAGNKGFLISRDCKLKRYFLFFRTNNTFKSFLNRSYQRVKETAVDHWYKLIN